MTFTQDQLKQAFSMVDVDQSGYIDRQELSKVLTELQISTEPLSIAAVFTMMDTRPDHRISFAEFTAFIQKLEIVNAPRAAELEEIQGAFAVFNKNGDGYITPEEFKEGMNSYGEKFPDDKIDDMFKLADLNNDNLIDIQEFKIAMGLGK